MERLFSGPRRSVVSAIAARKLEPADVWRERLEAAKNAYGLAVGACYAAMEGRSEAPLPKSSDPATIRSAVCNETAALNEYLRVLRIFSDVRRRAERERRDPE